MPTFSRGGGARPADSATTETQPGEAAKPATEPGEAAKAETQPGEAGKPATEPGEAAKAEPDPPEAAKAGSGTTSGATNAPTTPVAAKTGTGSPEPNLQERIEGLQGWVAEIERKQARRTYFGALAVLLAIAAAGAALYFGLTNRSDSAKKSDLDALTTRVDSLEGAVTKSSKDTQNALNASIAQLQQSISGLQKQQAKTAATHLDPAEPGGGKRRGQGGGRGRGAHRHDDNRDHAWEDQEALGSGDMPLSCSTHGTHVRKVL